MDYTDPIFIVGNSRSGTTLVSRILGKNSVVHSFEELHFFEQLWMPGSSGRELSYTDAQRLFSRLLGNAREGRNFIINPEKYMGEATDIIKECDNLKITEPEVYRRFLKYETERHNKIIPCEQTPRYVFFLDDILKLFPKAKIIVMLRDPRDVLLSQKNHWKRRVIGQKTIPPIETFRLWVNYHPILKSKLWNAVIKSSEKYTDDPRVKFIHFENLVTTPKAVMENICTFSGIDFTDSMLDVHASQSPTESTSNASAGISARPVGRWKKYLSKTEVYFCETINGSIMTSIGYELSNVKGPILQMLWCYLLLPIKGLLFLLFNIKESKTILKSIKRRLFTA